MKPFKLALAQMKVVGGEPETNLKRALEKISEAKKAGADMILLPECFDLGWTDASAKTLASEIPEGKFFQALSQEAKKHSLHVCAGLTEKDGAQVFNTAVLIGRSGELLLKHRKLNELEIGHDLYATGDRLGVVDTEWGRLGLMTCADGFAKGQVISRSLGYMGADVIISPSAWAVPKHFDNQKTPYGKTWLDCYGPVAKDFSMWIASVSNVGPMTSGPWSGWDCIGSSLVMDPKGNVALKGPYGAEAEELLYCLITPVPRPARGTAWMKHWASQPQ